MGCVASGLVLSGVLGSFMGIWGTLLGLGIGALGFWGMFKIQDSKGLYNKTKNNDELHIFPKRFNIKKFKSKNKNDDGIDLAILTDGLRAERGTGYHYRCGLPLFRHG